MTSQYDTVPSHVICSTHTQNANGQPHTIPLQQHGKQYDTDEEELSRQIVWEANRNYVQNHNEHADVFGFTLAMNEFADMVKLDDTYNYTTGGVITNTRFLVNYFCIPGIQ